MNGISVMVDWLRLRAHGSSAKELKIFSDGSVLSDVDN